MSGAYGSGSIGKNIEAEGLGYVDFWGQEGGET